MEKSIDLDVMSPVAGRRAFIQVKSQSSKNELLNYVENFKGMSQYDEMYYVCHSGILSQEEIDLPKNIQVIGLGNIAELVINAGLTKWLITKAS